jgi:lysophospholipase L1-like esterase
MKRLLHRERIYKLASLFIGILIAILISEIILCVVYPPSNHYYVWQPNLNRTFNPFPGAMPGIEGESRFIINSVGIRGEEFYSASNQEYRILTIGGSTTECIYLDQTEAWPYLLEEYLNKTAGGRDVWVGNVGKSGMNTRDHIMHVKYLLSEYPKIDTIIILVGINDFGLRYRMGNQYDPNFLNDSEAEKKQITRAFAVKPENYLPFYKRTGIYQFARTFHYRLHYRETVQDRAGEWYLTERENRKNAKEILGKTPDLSSALEEYSKNINTIIDSANNRSVRVIFMTQPTLWRPGLTESEKGLLGGGDCGNGSYYSIQALNTGMKKYNEKLLEVCSNRGIECIDLASQLPQDASVFYDDAHFNENGARLVAATIAEYLNTTEPFVSPS